MSRVGKKPIPVPKDVTVTIDGNSLAVKGPKGMLSLGIPSRYRVAHRENTLVVEPPEGALRPQDRALWGTLRALIANMIVGVVNGFERRLEIEGIGYQARFDGVNLNIQAGFTHPVAVEPPSGITVAVERNNIIVRGIDKQLVGQTAAKIRAIRPVEPYKGKGIRYQGEVVRRKAGKKAVGAGS
ncbi:MAG: 50S ribosomal protein L6 [bacterium]|nr:50S ribosomal protein L6 [bacterium]MDZ4295984.1 50S ribosomal protein L6 [Patescibacteria group bacterium]